MRALLVLLVVGAASCRDKPAAVAPPPGTPAMARPAQTRTLPKLDELAARLDVPGYAKAIRARDAAFLDVTFTREPIVVTATVSGCLACGLRAATADRSTLAVTVPPALRDRADLVLEISEASLDGAPAVGVYQLAFTPAVWTHAATLYYDDGVTQLRVIAAATSGAVDSREALLRLGSRAELERAAATVAGAITRAW